MSAINQLQQEVPVDQAVTDDIEMLRSILTSQRLRKVSFEEAKEVATGLIELYELLATEGDNEYSD